MHRRYALKAIGMMALAGSPRLLLAQSGRGVVRLVIPYAAGGQTDVIARMLANSMQRTLQRNIVVENRPGATGMIATKYVQSLPPDGDTLLFYNSGMMIQPMVQKSGAYDLRKELDPVAMTGIGPNVLMVHESVPAKTVPEFLAYAKSRTDGLNCANSGINSGGHIAAMLLEKLGDIKLNHIPFKGSAEVTTALVTGQVQLQVSVTTDSLNPYIKAGKIRMLAVATKERSALMPDIPTIGEFVPGYALDGWFGILAPAHTPAAVRELMSNAVKVALQEPATKERFLQLYMEPRYKSPQQFEADIATSVRNFRDTIRLLALTPQ